MDTTPLVPIASETKKLKRHRLRTTLIILGILLIGLATGVAATGLYDVPVISTVLGTNKPKDLGIAVSDEAYDSIKTKIPMKISGAKVDYAAAGKTAFTGTVTVDTDTSSEEITSWLARNQGTNPMFTNTQVKKIEGGLEISTMLQKYTTAPVYAKVMVTQTGPKSVALNIVQAKLGMFNVPEKYRQQAQEFFQDRIGKIMTAVDGFSMDRYEIHDDYSIFKGTFPAVVAPSAQGWSGLLSL